MGEPEPVVHPFDPVFDGNSRVLVLGTIASPASRASGFYYGHAYNRFWPLMAELFGEPVPSLKDVDAKKTLLLRNGVALWDVVHACDIKGAADDSIENAVAHDMSELFAACPGLRVYANGQTAAKLYRKLVYPAIGVPITALPSTSPANAGWNMARLVEAWRVVTT